MKHAAQRLARFAASPRALFAGAMAVAVAVGLTVLMTTSASGATTVPWEPDPNSIGTITFYDSSGNVITSGSADAPLAAFAVGSSTIEVGDTSAALYFVQPQSIVPLPANWSTDQATLFTPYPVTSASAPAVVKSATTPVVTEAGDDETHRYVR